MKIKREEGFTLVELMITMTVFVLVIAAASGVFTTLLTQFKQQSKIGETNTEGIIGLELLRQDIENAGYGLPWDVAGIADPDSDGNRWEHLPNYSEAPIGGTAGSFNDASRNIDLDANDGEAPRPVLSGNNIGVNNSDYLVIKSINVARNNAAEKWTVLKAAPFADPFNPRKWSLPGDDLESSDRVIVISTGNSDKGINNRSLIVGGAAYYTTFSNVTSSPWPPEDNVETRIIYGINRDEAGTPKRPFNRADYMIRTPSLPLARCADNTGVLYKATMNHDDSGSFNYLPLLDCVADMQIVFRADSNDDGTIDITTDDLGVLTDSNGNGSIDAQEIREQVKEVRVYILAHEGQRDASYTYPSSTIQVPAPPDVGAGLGSTFNLQTKIGDDYKYYRWKVYTIAVKPSNSRQ